MSYKSVTSLGLKQFISADEPQIFGRAGRPGYETSGVGYICTTHDKLDHYLQSVMSQHPIESKCVIVFLILRTPS